MKNDIDYFRKFSLLDFRTNTKKFREYVTPSFPYITPFSFSLTFVKKTTAFPKSVT